MKAAVLPEKAQSKSLLNIIYTRHTESIAMLKVKIMTRSSDTHASMRGYIAMWQSKSFKITQLLDKNIFEIHTISPTFCFMAM